MRKRLQHTPAVTPQPEHQGSRRVGPPVPVKRSRLLNVRGFFLPVAFYWFVVALGATMVEFGAMIYDMSCADCAYRGHGDGGSF